MSNEYSESNKLVVLKYTLRERVQIRSYFWSVFRPNAGKYGPEITPYLDTFHAVIADTLRSS